VLQIVVSTAAAASTISSDPGGTKRKTSLLRQAPHRRQPSAAHSASSSAHSTQGSATRRCRHQRPSAQSSSPKRRRCSKPLRPLPRSTAHPACVAALSPAPWTARRLCCSCSRPRHDLRAGIDFDFDAVVAGSAPFDFGGCPPRLHHCDWNLETSCWPSAGPAPWSGTGSAGFRSRCSAAGFSAAGRLLRVIEKSGVHQAVRPLRFSSAPTNIGVAGHSPDSYGCNRYTGVGTIDTCVWDYRRRKPQPSRGDISLSVRNRTLLILVSP